MFTITKQEVPTFDFRLEGQKKVHSVPLLSNLPLAKIRKIQEFVKGDNKQDSAFEMIEFMRDIFGADVIDSLTMAQATYLFEAWQKASTANGEETLGE
jgi:hypothetical protein